MDAIDGFVLVPVNEIQAMTPHQIGSIVKSLALAAKAARIKCAMESCFYPEQFRPHLHEIEKLLDEAKSLPVDLTEASEAQLIMSDFAQWRPPFGLSALQELHSSITTELRKEYFALIELRQKRAKKQLTPTKQKRLEEIVDLLHGCKICRLIDGNHTEECQAMSRRLRDVAR